MTALSELRGITSNLFNQSHGSGGIGKVRSWVYQFFFRRNSVNKCSILSIQTGFVAQVNRINRNRNYFTGIKANLPFHRGKRNHRPNSVTIKGRRPLFTSMQMRNKRAEAIVTQTKNGCKTIAAGFGPAALQGL